MGFAFGISIDDVIAVAQRRGVKLSDEEAEVWFDQLDADEVESAALEEDDMDDQTDAAHAEIARQLEALGLLT